MKRRVVPGIGLLMIAVGFGCTDRLAQMQRACQGTWVLKSRQLPDGTLLSFPQIQGVMSWVPIDSRKAHVTVNVLVEGVGRTSRRFDYAASTYEISTSAITRKRHLLIRQGYRASANMPVAVYSIAKTAKGKVTVEDEGIRFYHAAELGKQNTPQGEGFSQLFRGGAMVASYPGAFTDTWEKVHSP